MIKACYKTSKSQHLKDRILLCSPILFEVIKNLLGGKTTGDNKMRVGIKSWQIEEGNLLQGRIGVIESVASIGVEPLVRESKLTTMMFGHCTFRLF